MKVVTIVKGKVPLDKCEEFEAAYQSVKGEPLPHGLEMSFLVRETDDSGMYMIESIWTSRDALDAMRSSTRPRAVALFEEVGVTPRVEIHQLVGSVP